MDGQDHLPESAETASEIQRAAPKLAPAVLAEVVRWQSRIKAAKKHHEPAWKRIAEDVELARLGAPKSWVDSGNYVLPIVMRLVNAAVASLYAKDPKAYFDTPKRLDSVVWDGRAETLAEAQQVLDQFQQAGAQAQMAQEAEMAGAAPMGAAAAAAGAAQALAGQAQQADLVLREAAQVAEQRDQVRRVGETLVCLFNHYLREQKPSFKRRLKSMIRRAKVQGVAYLELQFQRVLQPRPDSGAQLADSTSALARLDTLASDAADGVISADSADAAAMQMLASDLASRDSIVVREGPVFDFLTDARSLIIDPRCRELSGFVGAEWIAREHAMTRDEIKDVFKIDVGAASSSAGSDAESEISPAGQDAPGERRAYVKVWRVLHKTLQQEFTIAEGYPGYLSPPAPPVVEVEGFWPVMSLVFNDTGDSDDIYPLSEVRILRHMQLEINRKKEAVREHRIAATPGYVTRQGWLTKEDKAKFGARPAHMLIEVAGGPDNVPASDLVGVLKTAPIDPALYEVDSDFQDVLRSTGVQEANLGGTSGATATEATIAESSRSNTANSDIDELDGLLEELAAATGQLMLRNLSEETVKRIVGPGAVWPVLTAEQLAEEVFLQVRAGSTGRPNKALQLSNLERAMPTLLQLPEVPPKAILRRYDELLELGLEDAIVEGQMSIVAQNAVASRPPPQALPMGGLVSGAEDDPNAQGAKGAGNAPAPELGRGPPTGMLPAPGEAIPS